MRVGLSAASVSRVVADLERHLGTRLVNRTTRTMNPTDEGHAYYQRCVSILDQVEEADRSIREAREVPTGVLRVSAAPGFGVAVLAPLLMGFLERYPQVRLDLSLEDRSVDMVKEGFDVALRFTGPTVTQLRASSLIARLLATFPNQYVASPAYIAARGRPTGLADLANHTVLLEMTPPDDRMLVDTPDGPVAVRGPLRTDNSLMMRKVLLAGGGIALMPVYIVQEDLRLGALVPVLPESWTQPLRLFAVYPPARTLVARVRAFVDFVAAALQEPPG